ncbi:MAG: guanylate kinase [Hyphomicrobiaceae bacterium]
MPSIERRGLMLVLSSPSGAGKTTLSREILKRDSNLSLSVSVTTRPPRTGEQDGVDYHFRTREAFDAMREAGGFLEWAMVHGNAYGTPRTQVMEQLEHGHDLLFDIDWQGAQQISRQAPGDTVRVFILPPSAAELEKRLVSRRQDAPEVIARRLAGAAQEISHWHEYDYVIVNTDVDQSLTQLQTILAAERLRRQRNTRLSPLVDKLLADLARDSAASAT